MYACYCSPNIPLDDFKAFIDSLANDIRATGLDAVVAGDFNSKSPMWGSPITDARGELLVEWAAELGLNALNLGDEPTFERGNSKSHIDITWANEAMTRHIHEWKVLSGEVFTYHNYIYFEVQQGNGSRGKSQRIFRFLDKDLFATKVKQHFSHSRVHTSPGEFVKIINKLNRVCAISVAEEYRNIPYWWNGEIENKRKECNRLRRILTRANRNHGTASKELGLKIAYEHARAELKRMILNTKKNKWKELLNELENDIWGDGYKIIMRRLGRLSPPYRPTTSQQLTIVKELFQTETQELRDSNQTAERVPAFLKEEMTSAAAKMKTGKAPGFQKLIIDGKVWKWDKDGRCITKEKAEEKQDRYKGSSKKLTEDKIKGQ
ncbi:Endonuclease-reverse transcriptase [Popillia japonica]|uniref:Endonuclease-reverse transcriptase n=1 Tax=Popillia japonica TaxID=7064 RepID=A0AAW1K0U0_POPJA